MLSRLAQEFADEIALHDWSDAPWYIDRAGHARAADSPEALSVGDTDAVRTNVAFVVAQVLRHADPNLDLHEFAVACGVPRRWTQNSEGPSDGTMVSGLRWKDFDRVHPMTPGKR